MKRFSLVLCCLLIVAMCFSPGISYGECRLRSAAKKILRPRLNRTAPVQSATLVETVEQSTVVEYDMPALLPTASYSAPPLLRLPVVRQLRCVNGQCFR